jgi:hypothetical protein
MFCRKIKFTIQLTEILFQTGSFHGLFNKPLSISCYAVSMAWWPRAINRVMQKQMVMRC